MADWGTHLLSSTVVASAIPDTNIESKALIVIGSILPDFIFPFYYKVISKKAGKKIKEINKDDYILFGYSTNKIRFLKNIYFFFHGLPFLILIYLMSGIYPSLLFLAIGVGLHFIYDIYLHEYEDNNFKPRPLYPISSKTFNKGFSNSWKLKKPTKIWIYSVHIIIIAFLVVFC